jgi:hypothetical protein
MSIYEYDESFVTCSSTVFCNGIGPERIFADGSNTDCIKKSNVKTCKARN